MSLLPRLHFHRTDRSVQSPVVYPAVLTPCTGHSRRWGSSTVFPFYGQSLLMPNCTCSLHTLPSTLQQLCCTAQQLSPYFVRRASRFKTSAPFPQCVLSQVLFLLFSTLHPLVSALSSALPPLSSVNIHAVMTACQLYIFQLSNVAITAPGCG